MGTPFHKNVPSWIIRYLNHTKCSKCSERIKKKDIIAIGVRELDDAATLYIEHKCPNCDHRAMKSFGGHTKGTVEELCCMLLEETQNKRRIQQSQNRERHGLSSEITDAEVKEFLSGLKKCDNHVDFLKGIGATEWLEPDPDPEEDDED